MCYEFSQRFTKARAAELARKERPEAERVTQRRDLQPEPQPVVPENRVQEPDTAPA